MAAGLFSRIAGRSAKRDVLPVDAPDKFKGTLIAHDLTKSYKGRQVVSGVSFGVRAGEAVGLLGPNGAGKTTCFYMVTGLVPVDQGKVEIDGFDVTAMPMYRRARLGVGYLPQKILDLPWAHGRGQHPRRAGSGRTKPQGAGAQPRCAA